jgi:hypothetical protein
LGVLAFLGVLVVSLFFSIDVRNSWLGIYGAPLKSVSMAIIFTLFFYFLVNNLNSARIKIIFWSILASMMVILINSICQLFGLFLLPFSITKQVNFNLLDSWFSVSALLALTLPLLTLLVLKLKLFFPKASRAVLITSQVIVGLALALNLFVLFCLGDFTYWPIAAVGEAIILVFFQSKLIGAIKKEWILPLIILGLLFLSPLLLKLNLAQFNDLSPEVSLSRGN